MIFILLISHFQQFKIYEWILQLEKVEINFKLFYNISLSHVAPCRNESSTLTC